jgi:1-deoxy-D-xylulose-5-phosphate reductoisomerase
MIGAMSSKPLRVAILGSTGSLGQTVLEVTRSLREHVQIVGLGAGYNIELLAKQVQEHRPRLASLARGHSPVEIPGLPHVRFVSDREMVASSDVDMVVIANVGRASLHSTWAAVEAGKRVALGNIEILFSMGSLLTRLAKERGATILPLDDEPAGVWQCLWGEDTRHVQQVTITSTWGTVSARRLRQHGPQLPSGVRHPRSARRIGQKRGIDASTLMTKATQMAAVHHLYDVPLEKMQVLYHPESLVRAMVEFQDGSVKAVLSKPDMRVPIQLALAYPQRWPSPDVDRLDLLSAGKLSFEPLEEGLFPSFRIALQAVERGDTYPAVVAAANEAAVNLFLSQQIGFADIHGLLERALHAHQPVANPTLKDLLKAEEWARDYVGRQVPE